MDGDESVRTSHVDVNGVRSVVRETGPASGDEAIVFVHGNPGSGADWEQFLLRTKGLARGIAPDMPGFGKAAKPSNFEYSIEGYARHLAGLLDQLGVGRAHLVLHDFGGAWGLWWAQAHPQRAASIVILDAIAPADYRWHRAARMWQTPLLGELSMLVMNRALFRREVNRATPLPPQFVDRMYDDFNRETRRAVLRLYRATRDIGRYVTAAAEALSPWGIPALVIWGKRDPYISYLDAQRALGLLPEAEFILLDGSGHWPFVDNPDAVADAIVPFLSRHVRGNEPRVY